MLSILIPTYNYNTYPLVCELKHQADLLKIVYEIVVQDDAGTLFIDENLRINDLANCSYEINESNLGRANNRNSLYSKSKFNYVLFLDSDVFPKNKDFISRYVNSLNTNVDIIYGGITYQVEKPNSQQILRWKYGKKREAISLKVRKEKYYFFLTANLLVNKIHFKNSLFNNEIKKYGYEDVVFLNDCRNTNKVILQIENEVFHLNLESSEMYLNKSEIALQNLKKLINNKILTKNTTGISQIYYLIEKFKLTFLLKFLFNCLNKRIIKNLKSSRPILFLFDLYRINYYASIIKNN